MCQGSNCVRDPIVCLSKNVCRMNFSCRKHIKTLHSRISSSAQNSTTGMEFILGKPYWSSSSRENSLWHLAMNFPRRFSRSDNLALVTETRRTSKQMLCSIVSFEWFLMKCDAKASVRPAFLFATSLWNFNFFFQARFVNMKRLSKNNTLSGLNIFIIFCKMTNRESVKNAVYCTCEV